MKSLVGEVLERVEMRRGLALADGGTAAFTFTGSFWIRSLAEFQQMMAEHASQIFADTPNFTDLSAILQVDEIIPLR